MKYLIVKPLFLFFISLTYFLFGSLLVISVTNWMGLAKKPSRTADNSTKVPIYTLFSKSPPVLGAFTTSFGSSDARAAIIEQFFARYHSPLATYGEDFVAIADEHNLPWELLPAITMQESNGGKKIPSDDCRNPFGWGIHSQGTLCFQDWREAIESVAEGLEKNYINQGLRTVREIMSKYNPISYQRDGSWGDGVEFFVQQIQDFNSKSPY